MASKNIKTLHTTFNNNSKTIMSENGRKKERMTEWTRTHCGKYKVFDWTKIDSKRCEVSSLQQHRDCCETYKALETSSAIV